MAAEIYIDQVNGPLLLIASQNGVLSASLALDNQGFLAFGTAPAQISTASYTQTASYVSFAQTASYVNLVASSSYTSTASYLAATSIIAAGNEDELIEAVNRCNLYGGGIISLTGEITLTANRVFDMTGIKVIASGGIGTQINLNGFTIQIDGAGCYFDNVRFFGQKGDRTGDNQTALILNATGTNQAYFFGCFFRSLVGGNATPTVGIINTIGTGGWSITFDNCDIYTDGGGMPAPFSINSTSAMGFLNIYVTDFKRIREDFNRMYIFGTAIGNSNFITDGSITYINPGVIIPNEFYFCASRGPLITQRNERTTPTSSLYTILADETGSIVKSSLLNIFNHNTASWAESARTASFLEGSVVSASYALSSSRAATASYYRPSVFDGTPGNILVREHWIGATSAGNTGWTATTSGTGTGAPVQSGLERRPGIVQIETGTNAAGRTTLNLGTVDFLFSSGVRYAFNCSVIIPVLSNATNEFDVFVGFGDNTGAGDMTDGAYFVYDRNNSTNWHARTANNNSRTSTNTGVNMQSNTWFDLACVVNGVGEALFYINQSLVATINSNIPQGSGRQTGVVFKIQKSNGTTERVAQIDYFNVFMEDI